MLKTKIATLLFLIIQNYQLYSQEILPFVENYTKSDYYGDNQNWDVTSSADGALYFANNHYLLRFDGVKWEKNLLPQKTRIRSVFADQDRIYTGSYKEFGYWLRIEGEMKYFSISNVKRDFNEKENEEIWNIFKYKNNIYFQSFNELYSYDGKKISKLKFPFLVSYCFIVGEQLLVASVQKGIYKIIPSGFEKLKNWSLLENTIVHGIEKHKNKTYIFTQKKGIFVDEKNKLTSWNHPLNEILKKEIINCAQFINQDKLIVGTARNGIYIIDLNKKNIININRNNTLKNNSILSIGLDSSNDLWLGLENGIAHIEVNTPIKIFNDNTGMLGSVYSVADLGNKYLIASNHGLFNYENKKLSLFPNTHGSVFNITKMDTKYIIGSNDGTFQYEKNKLSKINNNHGGWFMAKSYSNNTYLQASYSNILVYPNPNDFRQNIIIPGLAKPIRQVMQNKKNELWAADNTKGLYRVFLDDNYRAIKIDNVSKNNGISNDFEVKIFEYKGKFLFLIDSSWYTFDYKIQRLVKNELFEKNFKNITNIVSIDKSNFIIQRDNDLYHIAVNADTFIWNSIPEKYYKGKIINGQIRIFKTNDSYLLNLDDGFLFLPLKYNKTPHSNIKVEGYNQNKMIYRGAKIKYNTELRLDIISDIFGMTQPNLFYSFDNNKKILQVKKGLILLNNLKSGSHTVEIYKHNGTAYLKTNTFDFKVAQPWYFSPLLLFTYLIIIAFCLYLYYRWNNLRYKHKLKSQEDYLKHQKDILELKLLSENELNKQEFEKRLMKFEIQSKSSEVTAKSLSIAKQSEMIENIKGVLENEQDINKLKNEIRKSIKINIINKHEWESFETNINQIHSEFIKALTQKYSNLTPKDIKLCIFLKMNLSSKEIAPLMNITFRGVELHRYRLRKKLTLPAETNLSIFMTTL